MSKDSEIAQLIAEIYAAFDGVSREDGTTLHEAEQIDSYASLYDRQTARLLDTDSRWQDVPPSWLEEFPSAFTFLDAKGFRYYLPAVMIWTLQQHLGLIPHSDSAVDDGVVFHLFDPNWPPSGPSIFSLLTDAQRRVVARWLVYVHEHRYHQGKETANEVVCGSCWAPYL